MDPWAQKCPQDLEGLEDFECLEVFIEFLQRFCPIIAIFENVEGIDRLNRVNAEVTPLALIKNFFAVWACWWSL